MQKYSKSDETDVKIEALLCRIKEKDDEAFSELCKIFEPHLIKIISSYEIPESEFDDAKQEALIGLSKAVELYDSELSSFSTFAYICMKSGVLSFLRKGDKISKVEFSDDILGKISSPDSEPENKVIGEEEKNALVKKMESELSGFEMEVLLLFAAGDSVEKISSKLGKSKRSVDNALFRSRKKIRGFIKV